MAEPAGPDQPSGPDEPMGPDDGGGSATGGGAGRGRLVPILLATAALVAAVGAFALDGPPTADAVGVSTTDTPVLSARRAPELLVGPVAERRLTPDLASWIAQSPDDSCLVVQAAGSTVFDHRGEAPLPAASVQKVVTGTAALLAHDPEARLETVAATTADVSDGVVAGDLYVIGGGDPLLISDAYGNQLTRGVDRLSDVGELADAVAAAGVTRIEGDVVGDDSRYDGDRFHEAWPERFRGQNQIGPVSALNVNDGFSGFPAEPAGALSRVQASDPAANAAAVVVGELEARGITVEGTARSGQAPAEARTVATLPSDPLVDIVAQTLIDSDNDTAEMLFKELGLQMGGEGSWSAGQQATAEVLGEAGLLTDDIQIVDGSGLSDRNRVTCEFVVELLSRPGTGPLIVEGLAVAGETGTLRERFAGTEVSGRLRGKTGTLRNVNALAGQVSPVEGGSLYFAYVAHVPDPQEITWEETNLVDDLGRILIDYSSGVDEGLLLPVGYPAP